MSNESPKIDNRKACKIENKKKLDRKIEKDKRWNLLFRSRKIYVYNFICFTRA